MDVVSSSYLPGDQGLVEKIVYELKSQGIFDQFRKECIADVDTKPAYQNLRQRVEGNVAGFLSTQSWNPDMNKNQVREQLRKNIYESGFLEIGVERIVDQVVNPKINSIFHPKVEEVVYKYLGLQRPNRTDYRKEPSKVTITYNDLLPTDLEAVSPGSDILDQNDYMKEDEPSNDTQDNDDGKCDEDESPPFEPLEGQMSNFNLQQDVFTTESRLSDVSGVLAHESNSNDHKVTPMDVCSQDSQMSLNGSESRLSIITDEITKMDVCDNSNVKSSLESDNGSEDHSSFDKISSYLSEKVMPMKNVEEGKVAECEHQDKDKKNDDKKHDGQKHDSRSNKYKSGSDKHKSKYDKEDKNKRSKDKERETEKDKERKKEKETEKEKDGEKIRDKEKSSKNSLSRENSKEYRDSKSSKSEKEKDVKTNKSERDRSDKHRNEKDRGSSDKSDKTKLDKERSQKSDSHKSDRHKSDKEKSKHRSEREKSESDKLKTKERIEKDKADKDKNSKEKTDRDKKEKSEKHRSDKDKAQLDKQKSEKDRTDKIEKSDKEKVDKIPKEKSGTDKEKGKSDRDRNDKTEKDRKDKQSSSRHSSTSSRDKSSSRKEKDSSSKDKLKSSNSKVVEKGQNEVKNKESKEDHRSKSLKKEDKHSSHKKPKDKRKDKDDHYSAKERKYDRRSTDRDSNDGRSGKHVNTSPGGNQSHSHTHKSSQESTGSSNSGSGDSGNSEQSDSTKFPENMSDNLDKSSSSLSPETYGTAIPLEVPTVKLIKPKFASNFQEARRLMKIRKQLSKLEKQNQLSLASVNSLVCQEATPNTQELTNADDSQNNELHSQHTAEFLLANWPNRKSNKMKMHSCSSLSDEESIESYTKTNHKLVTQKLKAKLGIQTKTKKVPKLGSKSKSVVKVKWGKSARPKAKHDKTDNVVPSLIRPKKVNSKANLDSHAKNNSSKVATEELHVMSPCSPEEPDQIEEITPPLKDTVITMASWDALEAKLNQELLKVDYNSYESPDCDYSPVKTAEPVLKHSVHRKPLEYESSSQQLPEVSHSNSMLPAQVGSCSQQPQNTNQFHVDSLPTDFQRSDHPPDALTSDHKPVIVGECLKDKGPSQLQPEDELASIDNTASGPEISCNLQTSHSKLLITSQETSTNLLSHIPDESIHLDSTQDSQQMNEESDASKENIEPCSINREDVHDVNENASNERGTSEESSSHASIKEVDIPEIVEVDDSNSKQIEEMKNNLKNLIVNLENVCSKDMYENKYKNHDKGIRDGMNNSIDELEGKTNRIYQVRSSLSCNIYLHVANETKEENVENIVDSKTASPTEGTFNSPYKSTKCVSSDVRTSEDADLDGDCKFLVPTEGSDVYLNLIRNRIDKLEQSIAKQQDLITRLSNESKNSVQQERKRNSPRENDVTVKKICLAQASKGKLMRRRRTTLKAKNAQIYSHTDAKPPISTPSPPQCGKSVNSADHVFEIPSKKRRINKAGTQRYSSDDLYKPRTNFNNSRRSKDTTSSSSSI